MDADVQAYQKWATQKGINLGNPQAQAQAAPVAKPGTNWLSLLPSALAAGASFIPGVGSVVAGGLGAVGEGLREKLAGENIDAGKIATEGALSAVPFGLGKVAKLAKTGIEAAKGINVTAKGLQAADKAAQAAGVVDKAAETAAPVAEATTSSGGNILQRLGNNLQESARGIAPGAKAVGQEQLGVSSADELNNFLSSLPGTQGKNARDTLGILEKYHAGWGKQIGQTVKDNNIKLAPTDISAVKTGIDTHLGEIAGLPKSAGETALVGSNGEALVKTGAGLPEHAYIDNLYGDLGKVTDLKGLNELRLKLDKDAINYGRNSNAPDPVREQIAKAFRSGLADYVGERVPQLAPIQNLYSQSAHAQDFLKSAAASPKGGINLLGFFGGPKVGGGFVQGATAKAGQAATDAGNAIAGTATGGPSLFGKVVNGVKATGKAAGAFAAQEATRAAAGAAGVTDQLNGSTPAFDASSVLAPGVTQAELNAYNHPPIPVDASTGAKAGIDYEAEADKILASGADAKTQAAQLDLLAKRQAISAAATGGNTKPLSSTANELVGNVQNGLRAIGDLSKAVANNPNVANTNAAASILPGVAGNLARGAAGTQDYQTARSEVVDILARLRTGAAISKTEEKDYLAKLPQPGDSPDTIQQKLSYYRTEFQGIYDRAQGGSPALETAGATSN